MRCFIVFLVLTFGHIDFITSTRYSCDTSATCGCSKVNAEVNKIVGGESAIDASWGWSVSIQSTGGSHFCGGTVLSANYIITAAHCFSDRQTALRQTRIVVGIDKLSDSNSNKAQIRSLVDIINHPGYTEDTHANDISILQLNQPLILPSERNPARICVPSVKPSNQTFGYPASNLSLVAIGWGVLTSNGVIPSNLHLQQVTLNSMSPSHRMCTPTIRDKRIQFCAAQVGGGKDTCQGDSGGPIMHFEPNSRRWVLVGITSYGIGCGDSRYAGVYTRVSAYENWIRSLVKDGISQTSVTQTEPIDSFASRNVFSFSSSMLILGFSFFVLF